MNLLKMTTITFRDACNGLFDVYLKPGESILQRLEREVWRR